MERYKPIFELEENKKGIETMIKNAMDSGIDKSKKELKKLFTRAEKIAKEQGREGDYAYIMGIWKKMSGYKK